MASCTAASALRNVEANLVQTAGLPLPNTSGTGEVRYTKIITINYISYVNSVTS